ncbi:hypothetical protein SDC9_115735 [bioreactor metagenome]|uniref:Uncharacterized protein n=1 Tax=bioreactor metagenome TaxID=1076179 RepID=A0A645BW08_9ZZZZ
MHAHDDAPHGQSRHVVVGRCGSVALIHGLAQGLARLEVGHTLLGNGYGLAAARVAAHSGRAAGDGEAAKAANFDPMTAHQRVADCVENGFDGDFGIALRQLREAGGQFLNKVRSGHVDIANIYVNAKKSGRTQRPLS